MPELHGISQAAFDLIVREEAGNEFYYTRHYEHFDWPAGASGPTVGIGYDCGYVTESELRRDWAGIVSDATIEAMVPAVGLKGEAAHAFVRIHGRSVTIIWDQAIGEFSTRELPKWIARVKAALPNYELLPPDSKGALVSLAYNRGTGGFHDPGPRYAEMRAIRALMAARDFDKIPDEFLSMRRLWPEGGDLWRRRGDEAALFDEGLAEASASAPPAPQAAAPSSLAPVDQAPDAPPVVPERNASET
jgi:hypothetical protein